ncbi:MAG: hypothetical protein EB060_08530 [Proteobacteria bacterium]|nr:hypothetical protein [Pseudomonadota bacterium]
MDYGRLIDEAMHNIVKKALLLVAEHGLPGDHHFYISFLTEAPGVMIGEDLKKKYPDEMTIVVQHQYWDLEIEEDRFSVVLSFDNVKQNLTIPFHSITSFADPSVRFGLQFRRSGSEEEVEDGDEGTKPPAPTSGKGSKSKAKSKAKETSNSNNVVTLDSFRKK